MSKPANSYLFFHNPCCSKSRQGLTLLREHGIEPTVIEYLKTPPCAAELDQILKKLDIEPRGLLRTQESAYHDAGLDNPNLSRNDLIAAMVAHPILIERVALEHHGGVAVVRFEVVHDLVVDAARDASNDVDVAEAFANAGDVSRGHDQLSSRQLHAATQ